MGVELVISFYLILVACIFDVAFSYVMMTSGKQKPPEKWADWCYSKSGFAKYLEKKREHSRFLGPLHIDRFRLTGLIIFSVFCLFSLVIFCIDLGSGFKVTGFLNETAIVIMLICILLTPPLYEAFLVIWWSIIDRRSSKNQQIKRLQQVVKKRKKK